MEINFTELFATLGGFSAGIVVITQFFNNLFKVENSTWKQVMSWIVALVLACAGFVLQAGLFGDLGSLGEWQGWVRTAIVGIAGGLVSNGVYDINMVQEFVQWLFSFMKPRTSIINE